MAGRRLFWLLSNATKRRTGDRRGINPPAAKTWREIAEQSSTEETEEGAEVMENENENNNASKDGKSKPKKKVVTEVMAAEETISVSRSSRSRSRSRSRSKSKTPKKKKKVSKSKKKKKARTPSPETSESSSSESEMDVIGRPGSLSTMNFCRYFSLMWNFRQQIGSFSSL